MSGTSSGVSFTACGEDTDMKVYQGKSIAFDVVWGGDAPIDITGWTAMLQARDAAGALMMELSSANGRVTNGGASGKFMFAAGAEVSRGIRMPGYYELELTTPSGHVLRALSGKVTFVEEIAL